MLREIPGVRQDRPGLTRRWYQDDFFDLYTWHAAEGTLVSFQLCYDVRRRERALTWHHEHGFSHARVDSGDAAALGSMTPVLRGGAPFPHRYVRERFAQVASALDVNLRDFIVDKMREYGRALARGEVSLPRRPPRPPQEAEPG
jgi:hypothetical protein